jgi:putative membrane protein
MQGFAIRSVITMVAVLAAAHLLPGIAVDAWPSALGAALVLGILNAAVRPLLLLLSIPFIIVTLGLFIFVVNAALLGLAAWLVPGFHVAGFWSAIFGSLVISLISGVLNFLVGNTGHIEVAVHRR